MKANTTIRIYPSTLKGKWQAPPSKSYAQRALLMAALAKGTSIIKNVGHSKDELAAYGIAQNLGAVCERANDVVAIKGTVGKVLGNNFFVGESGLLLRMLLPVLAMQHKSSVLHAEGSLINRPINFWVQQLKNLGAQITTDPHNFPITIQGPIPASDIIIDGSASSQFPGGMLLAMAAQGAQNKKVQIENAVSIPYLHMTFHALKSFGSKIEMIDATQFYFLENNQPLKACNYLVEGDWSNAAFFLIAALQSKNEIEISGLNHDSLQADAQIISLFKKSGINIDTDLWSFEKRTSLPHFEFDVTNCPDLFPPLAVWAAQADGVSKIKGVHRLLGKESNRLQTIQYLLQAFGVHTLVENSTLHIYPNMHDADVTCSANSDHRIAMAAAMLALNHKGCTTIENADAVEKSYPDFFHHLQKLGATIDIHHE